MTCHYCQEIMKAGTHFYGDYCNTKGCFNSEDFRLKYGSRFKRVA